MQAKLQEGKRAIAAVKGRILQADDLHSSETNGLGQHVLLDCWGISAANLDHVVLESALVETAKQAGATILARNFHVFGPDGQGNTGFTGVLLLAESHISLHSWPEHGYVAFDIFMCGQQDAELAANRIVERLMPCKFNMQTVLRGIS